MSSESSVPPRATSAAPGRPFAAALLASLALLAAACVDANPVDPNGRLEVFGVLGGLEVGEALTLQGSQAQRIPLPGNAAGADFVIVPFLGSEQDAAVTVGIDRAALLDAVAPPAGRVSSEGASFFGRPAFGARAATARLHERLRREEIERLEPALRSTSRRAADVRPLRASEPPARVPVVGEILSLRTINDASADLCQAPLERGGRVAAVSDRAIVVSDTLSPAELGAADLAAVAAEFDALVYPVGTESFGAPTDIDGNGRVIIFFTPVSNEIEAAGFFFAGDLFSRSECPASNEAEILYILSPDPFGETALPVPYEAVASLASDFIAHELQHLINGSRRVYVNSASEFETVWMNEGLSHIAEELTFYATTPFGPGENLDITDLRSVVDEANRFIVGDLLFYASYAANPLAASLTGSDDDATRGAMWAFLRYAADREGRPDEEFFYDLVNSSTSGFANLNGVLETGDALDLMQAWTASVFADDHVGVPDFLTQPSWNFRSILPELMDDGRFPLDLQVLQSSGTQALVVMNGGASAFFRINVGAGVTGQVRLDVSGATARDLRVTVVRSR